MKHGFVKKWDNSKGFGFIETDDGEELFVHVSGLDFSIKEKQLRPNQRVTFDVKSDFKGDKAVNVRIVRQE